MYFHLLQNRLQNCLPVQPPPILQSSYDIQTWTMDMLRRFFFDFEDLITQTVSITRLDLGGKFKHNSLMLNQYENSVSMGFDLVLP